MCCNCKAPPRASQCTICTREPPLRELRTGTRTCTRMHKKFVVSLAVNGAQAVDSCRSPRRTELRVRRMLSHVAGLRPLARPPFSCFLACCRSCSEQRTPYLCDRYFLWTAGHLFVFFIRSFGNLLSRMLFASVRTVTRPGLGPFHTDAYIFLGAVRLHSTVQGIPFVFKHGCRWRPAFSLLAPGFLGAGLECGCRTSFCFLGG